MVAKFGEFVGYAGVEGVGGGYCGVGVVCGSNGAGGEM